MAWTGVATATVGQVLTAAFWNAQVGGNMAYVKGAVATYTPQIEQGATTNIAKTINEARWIQPGDVADVWVQLTLTAAGTAGSNVSVTLPTSEIGHASQSVLGHGWINNATEYDVQVVVNAAGSVIFRPYNVVGYWGSSPSVALASTNLINFHARYMAV